MAKEIIFNEEVRLLTQSKAYKLPQAGAHRPAPLAAESILRKSALKG